MKLSIQQVVKDDSAQVLFKVRLKSLARKLGFNSISIENMLIVAGEILSNQIKYAGKTGMVQLWYNEAIQGDKNTSVPVTLDIFAMDYGSGIQDIDRALKDGFTTSRTMGKGLGSIKRLADEFEIYSQHNKQQTKSKTWHGVAVWARFYLNPKQCPKKYQLGIFERAYHDINVSGDDIYLQVKNNRLACLHIDATGHGQAARDIVNKLNIARSDIIKSLPSHTLDIIARTLSQTDGAAGVGIRYNINTGECEYCAVGDMRLLVIADNNIQNLEVASGILGKFSRSYHTQNIQIKPNTLFISTSDGIRRNWTLETFTGLWQQHPQMIAFILGNQKGRNSDDQSMIILRNTL